MRRSSKTKYAVGFGAAALGVVALAGEARAQQSTFKLDRLEMPGAPDDGVAVFRPVTNQRPILYGQLAIGYSFRPMRMDNIQQDKATLQRSSKGAIHNQLTLYGSAGFEVFDRLILGVTFPFTPFQNGAQPSPPPSPIAPSPTASPTNYNTDGPAAGDLRVDLRGVLARSENRKHAFGAGASVFAPTGTAANFGADNRASFMFFLMGETAAGPFVFTLNTGVHLRPSTSIGDPRLNNGLGVGTEWRWALGAFIPLQSGKHRIGLNLFGQTGLADDTVASSTFGKANNTSLEGNLEWRMRFGPADHWWTGVSAGRGIAMGYGATDLRMTGMIGTYVPLLDAPAAAPKREKIKIDAGAGDRDHDGIRDDIDACPDEPEDHQGADPNDGCPMPPDKDGDGIPDATDKCPNEPEDKDGIDDGDGCPDLDDDKDGIPEPQDACPKEPGHPSEDPSKNGCPSFIKLEQGKINVLQQVHFATGSATILPDSFPMLQEIANLLVANPGIKRVSIEGHTDNKGAAALNKKLSQDRSDSVMKWLTEHGIAAERLEAHGFGMEKPIDDNKTEKGRAANRRVEFKIVDGK